MMLGAFHWGTSPGQNSGVERVGGRVCRLYSHDATQDSTPCEDGKGEERSLWDDRTANQYEEAANLNPPT